MQHLELGLVPGEDINAFWRRLARECNTWLAGQGVVARDAVLLLPFAQQLVLARRAWLAEGGWMPHLATTHSLAATLGPTGLAQPGQISFDAPVDALAADALLAGQSWAQSLRRSDPRAYRLALARLVEAAHALARAAAQRAPEDRAAYFELARERIGADPLAGTERALLLVALAWAESDERVPATDTLFSYRPSAWMSLQLGPADTLARQLLERADVPALWLDANLDLDALHEPPARVEDAPCGDFEELAQCSAAAVLHHLGEGRAPVALIAQDRVVVRRVRALLARQRVPLHDETGWTLATTPAASTLMALLRAALGGSVDDWLAWLKRDLSRELPSELFRELSGDPPAEPEQGDAVAAPDLAEGAESVGGADGGSNVPPEAQDGPDRTGALDQVDQLEAYCRRWQLRSPESLDAVERLPGGRVWRSQRRALAALGGGQRSLSHWLQDLRRTLRQEPLAELEGGSEVLEALWLSRAPWPGSAHEALFDATLLDGAGFLHWVTEVLESAQFVPGEGQGAPVVITPLVRAMARPFGAVVLPGADADTLGRGGRGLALLSEADAAALGLPTPAAQREAEAQAFAQALRTPVLTLLRCTRAGAEPLAASPLLGRLSAAAQRMGRASPLRRWEDPRVASPVAVRAVPRAAASPSLLPAALSASAVEALRRCPYQFFTRHVLGLREVEELDAELGKRDYGTWLHAVLHRFHTTPGEGDAATRLRAAAEVESQGLDPADFLPWRSAFERVLPHYLDWWSQAEAAGQTFVDGEVERSCRPFAAPLEALEIKGRIDRIDDSGSQRWLLDYKTGSLSGLKARVAEPLEDAQLGVYALLMGATPDLAAAYLALENSDGVVAVVHESVAQTAVALREGLQADLGAVLQGAPLTALGEGSTCEFCEARGVCRRDDWHQDLASKV